MQRNIKTAGREKERQSERERFVVTPPEATILYHTDISGPFNGRIYVQTKTNGSENFTNTFKNGQYRMMKRNR